MVNILWYLHLFSSSDKSVSRLRCHFSPWLNTCCRRRMFVWEELISSDSISLVTACSTDYQAIHNTHSLFYNTSVTASITSSTSSRVKVSSINLVSCKKRSLLQKKSSTVHLGVLYNWLDGLDTLPPLVLGKLHVGRQLGRVVLIQLCSISCL